jgi:hypothetical protein
MQHCGISESTNGLRSHSLSALHCAAPAAKSTFWRDRRNRGNSRRLSPDFLTTYGVLGWMPILIYIYSLLQALPGDRRYPDPLISHKPFLMVRLRIADQPRQRAHGQRRWLLSVSLICRVWDAAQYANLDLWS